MSTSRFRLLGSAVLVLAGLLAIGAYHAIAGGPAKGDALDLGDGRSEVSLAVGVGESVTYGYPVARNRSATDVRLVGVELIPAGPATGVRTVETRTYALAPGATGVGIARGYPPQRPRFPWAATVPVRGLVVRGGGDPVALLFGVTVTKAGTWRFSGVRVTYDRAGRRYTQDVDDALTLTAAP